MAGDWFRFRSFERMIDIVIEPEFGECESDIFVFVLIVKVESEAQSFIIQGLVKLDVPCLPDVWKDAPVKWVFSIGRISIA